MAALTGPRSTTQYGGSPFGVLPETMVFSVASAVTIYAGALVTIDSSGNANPSSATLTGKIAGRAETGNGGLSAFTSTTTGTGGPGTTTSGTVTCRQGVFLWDINGTLTKSSYAAAVYAYDDHTVTTTSEDTIAGSFLALDSMTGSQAMVLSA